MVIDRQPDPLPVEKLGENIRGDARRLMTHQGIAGQHQLLGVFLGQALDPVLKCRGLGDGHRQKLVVKSQYQGIVDQNIRAAGLMLKLFNLSNQLAVVRKKWKRAVDIARNQRLQNKNLARLLRRDRSVMHPSTRINGQTIERRFFIGDHLSELAFPAWIAPGAL